MKKRDKGNAPNIGDRIQYVIIKGEKGSKNYENSEDPTYVLEHDLPLDINYYLENQIKKPLLRIFSPILQNPEMILFSGEHTRAIYSGAGKGNSAFSKFIVANLFFVFSLVNFSPLLTENKIKSNNKYGVRNEMFLMLGVSIGMYMMIFKGCGSCKKEKKEEDTKQEAAV